MWMDEFQKGFQELKHYLSFPPLFAQPELGDVLFVYLEVSELNVSVVLKQEAHQHICYVIKNSSNSKTRCNAPMIKKGHY